MTISGTLILFLLPVIQEATDAEKMFQRTEKSINEADTIKVKFTTSMSGVEAFDFRASGTCIIQQGDKLRIDYTFALNALDGTATEAYYISNGDLTMDSRNPKEKGTTPKGLSGYLRRSVSRDGIFLSFFTRATKENRLDNQGLEGLHEFRLAGKEKLLGKDVDLLQYSIVPKGEFPNGATGQLWINPETHLPLKLSMKLKASKRDPARVIELFESYEVFTVDEKADDKEFKIP